jgi:hypothetical protein
MRVANVWLRLDDLNAKIVRLQSEGIPIEDPEKVPGFDSLRIVTLTDPDVSTLNPLVRE